jgi:hypothetical protein
VKNVSEKGLVGTFLDLRGLRFTDPFFSSSEDASTAERESWAKERRAAARAVYQHAGSRFGKGIVRVIWGSALLLSLGLVLPLGVRFLMDPSNPKALRAFGFSILYAAIAWTFVLYQMRQRRAFKQALEALGGEASRNEFLQILDWFDRYWPADTPNDDIDLPELFETRFHLPTTYAGHPVLVLVHRRSATRHHAPVRRIGIYLSAPAQSANPKHPASSAIETLTSLGYFVKRTQAGVYLCHPDINLAMLEKERVFQALEIARSLL